MHRGILIAAAITGGSGVALGAFGAHGLKKVVEDPLLISGYETAVLYQLMHALVLLAMAGHADTARNRFFKWSVRFFILGIVLFSGSLYLLTWLGATGSEATRFVGPVTPAGGLLLILGWIMLMVYALSGKNS